jgi:hypothetical protein
MAANLNMGRHRVTNVLDPSSGSNAVTRGFLERFVKILYKLPVAELLSKIGDKFLDMKGSKIRNLGVPTASSDAASKVYVDTSIANTVSGITAGGPTGGGSPASTEDTLSKSTADSTYLKLDGTSTMGGSLNMGRFAITHLREPSTGSDAATKGYIDRAVVPLVSTVTELSNNVVKLDGKSVMTGNLDLGRNSINNLKDPALGSDACTKGYVDRSITPLTNSVNRLNLLCIKGT